MKPSRPSSPNRLFLCHNSTLLSRGITRLIYCLTFPYKSRGLPICARNLVSYMFLMVRFALLVLLSVHAALGISGSLPKRTTPDVAFFDPTQGGGSWLDSGSGALGEPLNVRRFHQ